MHKSRHQGRIMKFELLNALFAEFSFLHFAIFIAFFPE